jgi:hypothetical protein
MMTIRTTLPPRGRDYRLDLFRGFANWAIYLDHIPNNVVNWVTQGDVPIAVELRRVDVAGVNVTRPS